MKSFLRNTVATILAAHARAVVRKYKPTIIMVTGSVGKTSTKDATCAAFTGNRYVRASEKSYNSEFGVPLTILGAANPWAKPFAWARVFVEAWALILFPNHYPKVLVLEVGADRPGDLARILRIATPDAVIVTKLPAMPVHVEAYTSPDAVREEEFAPAYALSPNAPLIISADDDFARTLAAPLEASVSTYGLSPAADIQVSEPHIFLEEGRPAGMESTVTVQGKSYPLRVSGALGRPQIFAPAAALAAAISLGVPLKDALKSLASYLPPPGRTRILRGKDGAVLIDDSYNASPAAVVEALETLSEAGSLVYSARKVAVLGDMLELGRYSREEHMKIGTLAATHADVLVTVGTRSKAIAEAARESGMPEVHTYSFDTSKEAAEFLSTIIGELDIVLIKGSQSVRTERVVEALLADAGDRKLLVRQDVEWKKR